MPLVLSLLKMKRRVTHATYAQSLYTPPRERHILVHMIMQIVNIGGGALLSSSFIQEKLNHHAVTDLYAKTKPFEAKVGVGIVILGLLALIERLGIFYFGLPLGSSLPQALPAIATGLLLGAPYFEQYAFLKNIIATLTAYKVPLGILAILCGLGSLLVGCISPICYPLYF